MSLLAPLLVALAPGTLHFLGDEGCPETGVVETQLRHIDPAALTAGPPQLALIEVHPRGLRVRLFDGQGGLLEDRLLEGSRSCADWANAAAALLATWESEIGMPDLLLANLSAEPVAGGVETELKRASGPVVDAEVGIGPSGAIAGDGTAAPGLEILLGLSPHGAGWGGQIGFETATQRSVTVGGGSARWERFVVSLGPYVTATFGTGALHVDVAAAVLAALLSASGAGIAQPSSASSGEVGLDVTFRLRWDLSARWHLWVRTGPRFWPKTEHVQVFTGDISSTATIPSVDLLATLGLSFTFGL